MRRHQLIHCFTLLLDGSTILCAGFVVQDLEVHFVAVLFYSPVNVVVGVKAVAVVLGAEGFH